MCKNHPEVLEEKPAANDEKAAIKDNPNPVTAAKTVRKKTAAPRSNPTPPPPSGGWWKWAIAIAVVALIALVFGVLGFISTRGMGDDIDNLQLAHFAIERKVEDVSASATAETNRLTRELGQLDAQVKGELVPAVNTVKNTLTKTLGFQIRTFELLDGIQDRLVGVEEKAEQLGVAVNGDPAKKGSGLVARMRYLGYKVGAANAKLAELTGTVRDGTVSSSDLQSVKDQVTALAEQWRAREAQASSANTVPAAPPAPPSPEAKPADNKKQAIRWYAGRLDRSAPQAFFNKDAAERYACLYKGKHSTGDIAFDDGVNPMRYHQVNCDVIGFSRSTPKGVGAGSTAPSHR